MAIQTINSSGTRGDGVQQYVRIPPDPNSTELADAVYSFAVLTDAALLHVQLNPKLFPGIPFQATAHLGFKAAHERTAEIVLKTVKQIIDEKGATKVVTVGHSLGGALALLDGLYLRLNLPSKVNVITRTFGQPRVSCFPSGRNINVY